MLLSSLRRRDPQGHECVKFGRAIEATGGDMCYLGKTSSLGPSGVVRDSVNSCANCLTTH